MKKNLLRIIPFITFIMILLPLRLQGQSEYGQESLFSQVRTLELRNIGTKNYSDIEGTPYYSNKFTESVVYFEDGNYSSISLRYDIFRDEMEFNKDNKTLWLIKKGISYIRYGNDTIILLSVDKVINKPNYCFLVDDGRIKLLYRKVIKFFPYVKPQAYANPVPDRFLPDDDIIYLKEGEKDPVRILTKKGLLSFFSGDQEALKFIKSKKIRPDKIEDLHLLVSHINKK